MRAVLTSPPVRYKQNRIRTTVVFYGRRDFERKTTQADAKESGIMAGALRLLKITVRNSERLRKKAVLQLECA